MDDMRRKEVINVKDGSRLGPVCDIEINTADARINAIIIYGRLRLFGLLGREEDIIIQWKYIQIIGDDTILVNYNNFYRYKKRTHRFGGFFSNG
jgi:YlmC/YmxH family sporulation protein